MLKLYGFPVSSYRHMVELARLSADLRAQNTSWDDALVARQSHPIGLMPDCRVTPWVGASPNTGIRARCHPPGCRAGYPGTGILQSR